MANCTGTSSKSFVSFCDVSDEFSECENVPYTAGTSSDGEISKPKSPSTNDLKLKETLSPRTVPKINFPSGEVCLF